MKLKKLIIALKEVEKYNKHARVYLENGYGNFMDFTGFGIDDNNDIVLSVEITDQEA